MAFRDDQTSSVFSDKLLELMEIVEHDHAKRTEILECLREARIREGRPV
jgi:hypothetical protein